MSKHIDLTQGHTAIVDDMDYEYLNQFKWCVQQYKNKTKGKQIYAKRYYNKTQITMHRFLLGVTDPNVLVDHINGNGLDNRRSNLRFTDKKGNAANRPKDRLEAPTSPYKGVYYNKLTGSWCARIHVDGRGRHLGLFLNEIDAARAYNKAALQFFGEFACVNLLP